MPPPVQWRGGGGVGGVGSGTSAESFDTRGLFGAPWQIARLKFGMKTQEAVRSQDWPTSAQEVVRVPSSGHLFRLQIV